MQLDHLVVVLLIESAELADHLDEAGHVLLGEVDELLLEELLDLLHFERDEAYLGLLLLVLRAGLVTVQGVSVLVESVLFFLFEQR